MILPVEFLHVNAFQTVSDLLKDEFIMKVICELRKCCLLVPLNSTQICKSEAHHTRMEFLNEALHP